ncbi:MAG: hypothetical protein AABY22_27575, partial [Nanoarchaeota archaeon]
LKRSSGGIFTKASSLKIHIKQVNKLWTDEKITLLKDNYYKYGGEQCVKILNLSLKQIANQARKLNLHYLAQTKENYRFCKVCLIEKPFKNFHNCKNKRWNKSDTCIECSKTISKIRRTKFKNKISQQKRKYYQKNKTKLNQKNKLNRSKINAQKRNREKIDINYKIQKRIRNSLYEWVNKNGGKKIWHTQTLLGCSFHDFKDFITKQFTNNQTWKNWGVNTWHIDHIIPSSVFNILNEEEVKLCWNYHNLQPLDSIENISTKNNCLIAAKFYLLKKIEKFGINEQYNKMLLFLESKVDSSKKRIYREN